MQPPTNHPPTISTYLIFNQLRIIHPQFRPKSRYLVLTIVIEYSMVVVRARSKEEAVCRRGPHKLWLKRATIRLLSYFRRFNRNLRESLLHDRSCLIVVIEASIVMTVLLSVSGDLPSFTRGSPDAATSTWWDLGRKYLLYMKILWQAKGMSPFFRTRMIGKTLTRVTAGTRLGVSGASLSPTEDSVLIFEISKYRHDRSCLEMSEADGVDGGAFRKRGLTHLQWAEKPEAPEAERHLGTRIVE
ncbi:hypothetical protein V1478_000011 [Vespula squamosa]|uniref:Uncharacterized protein n=3 Tax=Vespula squamosa TaxID=30214 RepID=A0ABD2C998_VESSQ